MTWGSLAHLVRSVVGSPLVRLAGLFGRRRSGQEDADGFNERLVRLNRHSQAVVDDILVAAYPGLQNRVLTVQLPGPLARRFPVVSLHNELRDRFGRDAVTVLPFISDERDSTEPDRELIEFIGKTGRHLWDNEVFRLLSVSDQGQLSFGITRYFKALTTCDRFLYELVRQFPANPTKFRLAVLARRELLGKWHEAVDRIVLEGQFHHISAALGVSVLSVFRHVLPDGRTEYLYPTVEQSDTKNGACDRHVVPSFIFEPFTASMADRTKELDLEYQVLREFGEEILGIGELDRSAMHWETVNGLIENNAALKALRALLKQGRAVLRVTGLWLDLLRLRPEVTCTLIVDDVSFLKSQVGRFGGNWENVPGVRWSSLESELEYESILSDGERPICPPGAAALVTGRAFALQYLSGRTESIRSQAEEGRSHGDSTSDS